MLIGHNASAADLAVHRATHRAVHPAARAAAIDQCQLYGFTPGSLDYAECRVDVRRYRTTGPCGSARFAAFAMGKFGLRALAQSMARELGPRGIHVAHTIIDGSIGEAGDESRLAPAALAGMEFQTRLQLARHGIVPALRAHLKRAAFSHPSEEMFANLLDFYRIQWQYEPRSFPLQWDKDGKVMEAFTPDFYLPEVDLYVELTTMKQTLVTRKNRKIKLLRAIYPHINIQVFYQKDFQDLVFKYGLRTDAAS